MCVGSPTAGAWSSFQRRPDDEFETDRCGRRTVACPLTWASVPDDYAEQIRALRRARGLSQAQLATLVGAARKAVVYQWVRQAQRDAGHRPGLTTSERERLKELEREVRELKRANEILRKAFAYFAQAELDRRRT